MIRWFLSLAAFLIAFQACAQTGFPTKPVRLLVTNSPPSSVDVMARGLAEGLQRIWNQAVVVENRAGASGILAVEGAARAEPNGYTLLVHAAGHFTFHPWLYEKLSYDVFRDFIPISRLAGTPIWIVVNPSVPAKTVKELLAYAKAQDGKLPYATVGGTTGLPYLAAVMAQNVTGVKFSYVPYKAASQAVTDLLGGRIQMMFDAAPGSLAHVQAGRLRALAVLTSKRFARAPDVPTVAEAGLPEITGDAWIGLSVRSGTPMEIVGRIHADSVAALKQPDLLQRLTAAGLDVNPNTPDEFAALIKNDSAKWGKVIRDNNIKAQ